MLPRELPKLELNLLNENLNPNLKAYKYSFL